MEKRTHPNGFISYSPKTPKGVEDIELILLSPSIEEGQVEQIKAGVYTVDSCLEETIEAYVDEKIVVVHDE